LNYKKEQILLVMIIGDSMSKQDVSSNSGKPILFNSPYILTSPFRKLFTKT